jgi:GNAT superfamily N-acetyltransferase
MQLDFTLLNEKIDVDGFDCNDGDLNSFLKNLALLFQHRHFGVTVVCSKAKSLIGYYTLCPASVQRGDLPEKMITGPRPNPIPGFRICRLAVDKSYQGKGHGKIIFVHALKKCLDQAEQIGGSVIIIDAKHTEAKRFYEHFGFIPLSEESLILVQTIKYIKHHFNH